MSRKRNNEDFYAGFSRWTKRRMRLKRADLMSDEALHSSLSMENEETDNMSSIPASLTSIPVVVNNKDSGACSYAGIDVVQAESQTTDADIHLGDLTFHDARLNENCPPQIDFESINDDVLNTSTTSLLSACTEEEINDSNDYSEDDTSLVETDPSVYLPILCRLFYLNDHLTKSALDHHLRILVAATKTNIKELTSPFRLFSKYKHLNTSIKKTYVCRIKECDAELISDEKQILFEVQPCGHKHVKNRSSSCYLLQLPIAEQIVHYINTYHKKLHNDISEEQDEDPNYRSNVRSGANYRALIEKGIIDKNTITLQINTDGAQSFKSSKFGIWPLIGIINETSYKIRRSSIILIALWYGNKKPPRNTLLNKAIKELNWLQSHGVCVDGETYKVRALIISTDTVARPLVRNSTQFNGEFGCDFCLHPGERVPKGKGNVRVYPEPNSCPTFQPRSLEQHNADISLVKILNQTIRGIVGSNPFEELIDFDHVEAYVPEYMHSCCLGVFKLFLHLWIDNKYKNEKWYIGKLIKVINARLAQAKPPYDISRTIDSISDLTNWKASMYRTFTLYYFHLLQNILPAPYFNHYSDLVYGMFLLLQERVCVDDVIKVEVLFRKFTQDAELLYGIEYIGINIHFLTHLPRCVLKWGCLWATSAYIPEWFNGVLLSMCKGTQAITDQMSNSYLINLAVREEAICLLKTGELPPNVESLFKDLLKLSDSTFTKQGKLVNNSQVKLIGKPFNRKLSIEEIMALKTALQINHSDLIEDKSNGDLTNCQFFNRFYLKSIDSIFTTSQYSNSPKRINYCGLLSDGTYICVENIVYVPSVSYAFVFVKKYGSISKQIFLPKPIENINFNAVNGQTASLTGKSSTIYAFDPRFIVKKCILSIKNDLIESYLATAMANHFETD